MRHQQSFLPTFVLALCATAALAQNPSPNPPQQQPPQQAQPQGQPAERKTYAHSRLETLLQGITLAGAQQSRVDSILARYAARVPATLPEVADSAGRRQMFAMLEQMDREVRGVLTAEQQPVWDRNVEAWRRSQGRAAD